MNCTCLNSLEFHSLKKKKKNIRGSRLDLYVFRCNQQVYKRTDKTARRVDTPVRTPVLTTSKELEIWSYKFH